MDQYRNVGGRTGDSVAESSANRIWLTSDAHKIWDESRFTIIPDMKEQGQGLEMVGWRTHRLNEHQEVLKRWHNKPPSPVEDRAGEYFYARFIWDIFPLIQGFHHGGPPRHLVVYNQSQCKYEVKMLTKAERRIFTLNQGRTRSVSPTKRQRSAQPGDRSERSGGSTYRRSAFKKQRLSPLDRSQDSAIAGFQNWTGDSDSDLDDAVLRHRRSTRSPDFLPSWMSNDTELDRGRSQESR
jgi:hypothetical protein